MNAMHPMRRFLGLDPESDPLDILGISVSELDEGSIRSALERRETQITDHPDGESEEAKNVRQHVHDAAQLLLNPMARMSILARHVPRELLIQDSAEVESAQKLTSFDRDVLGILVACGGWNARSRARLMAVASRYGVSNERLLSVLTGMAAWLQGRASRARPEVSPKDAPLLKIPDADIDEKVAAVFDRFVNRWMSDLRSDDPKSVNRMSILFGAIALLLFGFMIFVLTLPSADVQSQSFGVASDIKSSAVDPSSVVADTFNQMNPSGIDERFLDRPDLPSDMTSAADSIPEMIRSLNAIVIDLNASKPASDLHSEFAGLIEQASAGWFLVGVGQREQLLDSISMVFDSISSDQDALGLYMEPLRFQSGELESAEQIPESAFRSGVLSMLAGSSRQSPTVRSLATKMLGRSGESGLGVMNYGSGVLACLESFLPRMVELVDIDGDSKLQWYLWVSCIESLDDVSSQIVYAEAVDSVIRGSINPASDGTARDVLADLLSRFDYDESVVARDMVLGWYTDSDVPLNRLEALTRLLVELNLSDRFDESIIIQPDSGPVFARDQRESLSRSWGDGFDLEFEWRSPVPDGFDPVIVGIWNSAWEVSQSKVMQMSDASLLRRQLEIRVLNEAASALSEGSNQAALKLIRDVEVGVGKTPDASSLIVQEVVSLDAWSVRLSLARTLEDKLEILDQLRGVPSGSFDSDAAIQLADIAYKAASRIRTKAQEIIISRFSDDPEIMIALLDSLPERPTKELGVFLESLLNRELPEIRSERWRAEVKRLMVERSLLSRLASSAIIDQYSSQLSESYADESRRLGTKVLLVSPGSSPGDAIAVLCDARMDRLEELLSISDVRLLADLRMMHDARLRLAGDSIQASLMQSFFLFELLAMEWSVRLPSLSDQIEVIAEDLRLDLPVASHVLEQMVLVEEAMGNVWKMVLDEFVERQEVREGGLG